VQQVAATKKSFHIRDLRNIKPLTDMQGVALDAYFNGNNIALLGCAGTGKTFLALYMALSTVLAGNADQVIIVRSPVPVREQGFLPGELAEKEAVYESPYRYMCDQLFTYKNSYENLKTLGKVFFLTTSFSRGLTFDNSIVLMDEAQSFNAHEADTIITRLGDNSKLILCGDGIQTDLKGSEKKGFYSIISILSSMDNFSTITFGHDDIVRSGFVREYIIARDKHGLVC
jgi:phosphate starvation-inducible protein PhoH